MAIQTTPKKLYDLLVSKNFIDLEFYDTNTGQPPEDVADADLFAFKWTATSGKNYGTATIILGEENNLEFYFGDNLAKGIENPLDKQELYDFQHQLKQFATSNMLDFDLVNTSKLKYALAGRAKMTESLFESWNGTKTTSWTDKPTSARLMIRHQRPLQEGEARHRYIESLFVETADGERYKLPFKKLAGGRAMVEHVRQGGKPYDVRGLHISEMVEELNVLSRFNRANHGKVFEGDTEKLVTETKAYYKSVRHAIKSLASARGYQNYFENWNPVALTEQGVMVDDIKLMFVEQNIDTRIEEALPMLAKIKQGNNMKQADVFENWADEVTGDTVMLNTPEQQDKLVSLLSQPFPVGPDAENAAQLFDLLGTNEEWYNNLETELQNLAASDADGDGAPIIIAHLQELSEEPNVAAVLAKLDSDEEPADQTDLDQEESNSETVDSGYDTQEVNEEDLAKILEFAGIPQAPAAPKAPTLDEQEAGESTNDLDKLMQDLGSGERELYDVMYNPNGATEIEAARILQGMYDNIVIDTHLHPDDDFEQIEDRICDQLSQDYPEDDGQNLDINMNKQSIEPELNGLNESYETNKYGIGEFKARLLEVGIVNLGPNQEMLSRAKETAKNNSKGGYVQHVNQNDDGTYSISDWYDGDKTVASYEGGYNLDKTQMDASWGSDNFNKGGNVAHADEPVQAEPSRDLDFTEDEECMECGGAGMHEATCSHQEKMLEEGKVKEVATDLNELSPLAFKNKYGETKADYKLKFNGKKKLPDEESSEKKDVAEANLSRIVSLAGIIVK